MLKARTMAAGVTNLSDARYFASYGVDWITFPSSRHSDNLSSIKEIIDWCEGPQFAIELDEADEHFATFVYQELNIDGFIVDHRWLDPALGKQLLWVNPGEDKDDMEAWEGIILSPSHLKDLPARLVEKSWINTSGLSLTEVNEILDTFDGIGLVLFGSQEEKTGFKSFEDLDEWIDLLLE